VFIDHRVAELRRQEASHHRTHKCLLVLCAILLTAAAILAARQHSTSSPGVDAAGHAVSIVTHTAVRAMEYGACLGCAAARGLRAGVACAWWLQTTNEGAAFRAAWGAAITHGVSSGFDVTCTFCTTTVVVGLTLPLLGEGLRAALLAMLGCAACLRCNARLAASVVVPCLLGWWAPWLGGWLC
jgi:hypothetical protein